MYIMCFNVSICFKMGSPYSYLKSPLFIIFSRMDVWKNKEKFLKMYLESPWKVFEKGMSWSVGTMLGDMQNVVYLPHCCLIQLFEHW